MLEVAGAIRAVWEEVAYGLVLAKVADCVALGGRRSSEEWVRGAAETHHICLDGIVGCCMSHTSGVLLLLLSIDLCEDLVAAWLSH